MALREALVMETRMLEALGAGKGDTVVLLGPQSSATQMHAYTSNGLDAELSLLATGTQSHVIT